MRAPTSTISCSSSTRRAPAASLRCALCRKAKGVVLWLGKLQDFSWKTWIRSKRKTDQASRFIGMKNLAIQPAMRIRQHYRQRSGGLRRDRRLFVFQALPLRVRITSGLLKKSRTARAYCTPRWTAPPRGRGKTGNQPLWRPQAPRWRASHEQHHRDENVARSLCRRNTDGVADVFDGIAASETEAL